MQVDFSCNIGQFDIQQHKSINVFVNSNFAVVGGPDTVEEVIEVPVPPKAPAPTVTLDDDDGGAEKEEEDRGGIQ